MKLDKDIKSKKNKAKKKKGKLSKKQKIAISVILILYAAVIFVISCVVFYKPSVSHEVPFLIPRATDEAGNTIEQEEFKPIEGTYNFLVLGRDVNAFLTDVMMVINLDNNNHNITVMQIPRDTYVSGDYPTNKTNAVFSTYYYQKMRETGDENEAERYGLEQYTKLIEQSLCINIHYSAIMNLEGFKNIVDILGGVEVDVQFDMFYDDPAQGLYINIPAGRQTLNGEQAEGFVRYRYGYAMADMGRQDAQKKFLFALFEKVKSAISITNVSKLTQIGSEIYDNLTTDIPATDMVYFAKCILSCDLSKMKMMTIPGSLPQNGFFVINREGALAAVNAYFNAYDNKITNYMFDPTPTFNNPYDYATNNAYNLPAADAGFGDVYTSDKDIYITPSY